MALASVVLYGACKTHIYPVYIWVLFDDYEAITTLSRGRAALRWENGRSPRKAPPGPRPSASEGRRSVAIVAGPCGAHKLAIHTPRFRVFLFSGSLFWAYFVYEWCGVRFDCRECAFFLCVHRCELIGFAGRLQCTGSHFPSPEVRFLLRGFAASFVCEQIVYSSLAYFCSAESAASYH